LKHQYHHLESISVYTFIGLEIRTMKEVFGKVSFDWTIVLPHLISVSIAYLLALPVAWDREKEARSAGLRTFPLVAVASCGYMLAAASILGSDSASMSRILQGLITGIGFIGGGAILKDRGSVHGTATAASIWKAAVAFRRYEVAVVLSLINFATLRLLTPLKQSLKE
jgi:putative Mg2+ transporter-C (MgtC) family protein